MKIMSTKQLASTTLALVLCVLGLFGCARKSQTIKDPHVGPGVQPTAEVTNPACAEVLLLVIDKTQSPAESALEEFAPRIKDALRGCETLRVVLIVNDGADGLSPWNAKTLEFSLSEKADDFFDEAAARADARKRCKGRGNCEEKLVSEARTAFEVKATSDASSIEEKRAATLEKVMAAVMQRPLAEPPCTDLAEMAVRIAQTPATHVIWLTDGVHGCATPLKQQTFANKVLLALMPVEHEKNFSRRLAALSETYPNATIKPVGTLSTQVVLDFLRVSEARLQVSERSYEK